MGRGSIGVGSEGGEIRDLNLSTLSNHKQLEKILWNDHLKIVYCSLTAYLARVSEVVAIESLGYFGFVT